MSYWQEFNFESEIRKILGDVIYTPDPNHHLKRPYMTTYQIAIEFNRRNPNVSVAMEIPVGGLGVNSETSLAQYIAKELSQRIKREEITDIEGAFLSNNFINELKFNDGVQDIYSSNINTQYDHSIFRLIGSNQKKPSVSPHSFSGSTPGV